MKLKYMQRQRLTKINKTDYQNKSTHSTQAILLSAHVSSNSLLQLQRAPGNHAVGCFIQAKLKVNQPGDIYEPETLRGKKLLAHESTHVIQQNPTLINKANLIHSQHDTNAVKTIFRQAKEGIAEIEKEKQVYLQEPETSTPEAEMEGPELITSEENEEIKEKVNLHRLKKEINFYKRINYSILHAHLLLTLNNQLISFNFL